MNRRSFFGLFAALPFAGAFAAKAKAPVAVAELREFDSQLTGKVSITRHERWTDAGEMTLWNVVRVDGHVVVIDPDGRCTRVI